MKKILQVTTYPIENPDHGGKLRCFNIRKFLRKDFDVQTLSFDVKNEEKVENLTITLDNNEFNNIVKSYLFFDWGINNYLEEKLLFKKEIFDNVKKYNPDIILVEQGFLNPLINEMKKENILKKDIFIIYSSHNIEYKMKKEIYKDTFENDEASKYISIVKNIEYEMIKSADLIFAVSQNDVDYINKVVSKTHVYLYRNGHNGIMDNTEILKWEDRFNASKRNYVYIASWHGPNIKGLYNLIENGLLDLDSKEVTLWVFGSVGDGLKHTYDLTLEESSPLKLLGPSSTIDIDSAISICTGIVLPIWEGGGSNLKTAQALLSNKNIIATKFSFRGFEEFIEEDGVFLTDNPALLVNELDKTATNSKSIYRGSSIDELQWDKLLLSMATIIKKHLKGSK